MFSNISVQNITALEDWTEAYFHVRWIQLSMAVLSMLGSFSIIVCAAYQNLIRTAEVQPLFLLSVTDLLLSTSWLIGAAVLTHVCDNHVPCYNLHTVTQIFYLSSFFYTLHYTWVLYRGLQQRYLSRLSGCRAQFSSKPSLLENVMAVLSCLVPVLLMVPVFAVGNSENCYANFTGPNTCLLMHAGPLYSSLSNQTERPACHAVYVYSTAIFLCAFLLTLLGIVVLMGRARGLYRRCASSSGFLGGDEWAVLRVLERRMVLYPSAFFCCWGPAILLAILILIRQNSLEEMFGYVLYIIQALTSGSQGLLNCVVYGWTQRRFRTLSGSCRTRSIDTQTPLLRSQKRGYSTLRPTATSALGGVATAMPW